jgi:hypothetical protein
LTVGEAHTGLLRHFASMPMDDSAAPILGCRDGVAVRLLFSLVTIPSAVIRPPAGIRPPAVRP